MIRKNYDFDDILFDKNFNEIALRFGYDFYMYFNSNQNLEALFIKVEDSGLYKN